MYPTALLLSQDALDFNVLSLQAETVLTDIFTGRAGSLRGWGLSLTCARCIPASLGEGNESKGSHDASV